MSDRHRRGRSVVLVEFASGSRIVYKPKPLRLEAAFTALIEWCNELRALPDLRAAAVIDRGDYGWVEYIEHEECIDESAAERFYYRAGMLLCLAYVTRATDCHYENLIAAGEHPVLVDAETLLYPEPQPLDDAAEHAPGELSAEHVLSDSVLRTGLLPRWEAAADDASASDISAFGGVADEATPRKILQWNRINTDLMFSHYEDGQLAARQNVPRLAGRPLSAVRYETEVIRGFTGMYRLLMAHRNALAAADGPLAAMGHSPVRFIYRPTRVYSALLVTSWTPEALRSGIEFGLHLEQLARAFLVAENRPAVWPVLAAEIHALEQMDVPLFVTSSSDTDLNLGAHAPVSNAFRRPSYDEMLERIASMSEALLKRQTAIIQCALHAKAAQTPVGDTVDDALTRAAARGAHHSCDLVREATAIGLAIQSRAFADGEGVDWIGVRYMPRSDRFQAGVLNDSLYDGCCGVALFLAALSRVTGDEQFCVLALRSVRRLRNRLQKTPPGCRGAIARTLGLGAAVGLGSIIYSFVRAATFIEREGSELVDDAATLADWFTPDVISADERLDVMSGAAGGILGLLALYSACGRAEVLDKANRCGDHLLEQRVESCSGHRAWKTIGDHPLTGLSHGAAGIAYALIRLYAVTQNRSYLDAAFEAIEFERAVFSKERGNWPDFRRPRSDGGFAFPIKWCHGAAGIALARLGCRNAADIPGLDDEIAIGLQTTRDHYLQNTDYVCCGNFGRTETLLMGSRVNAEPELSRQVEMGVSAAVARATERGYYELATGPTLYNPGFFQGTAGIGYQLLRLADRRMPSVLLWE